MTRFPRSPSHRPFQIIALCLTYSLVISLFVTPNHRNVQASPRTEREAPGNSGNQNPVPSPTPSPEPSASPSPETSPTPEPAPTMTPTTIPTPTQGVPTQDMPNLDGLRNVQPEEPEVPEVVPSTRCSPGQPDCNPTTGNPDPPSQALYWERGRLARTANAKREPLPQGQMLAWNGSQFSTPFLKYGTSREATDSSVINDAFFSLFEPQSGGTYDDFVMARLDPDNRTGTGGEDILSRNFNWSLPLVGMAGRSGLNLGLSLSYNSLVWTRSDNFITYDADNGFPTPGFRLGFPVVYGQHYNSQTGTYGYLMLMPSGSRVELRQVSSTNVYEAADSSYLQLIDNEDGTLLVRSTDGMQLLYESTANGFRCSQVKDRNGNYLSITNSREGRIESVTDTLGRVFNFNYDEKNNLDSITQTRGESEYRWVRFYYTNITLQTNFTGLTIVGLQNGSTLPVLSKLVLPDGTYYKFSYNTWGQVYKITNYAADSNPDYDNHSLNYVSYNLPLTSSTAQTDCPRFTQLKDWAENWNNGNEAVTNFAVPTTANFTAPGGSQQSGTFCQIQTPDGVYQNVYSHSSGWDEGLPILVNTYDSQVVLQRQAVTSYTQDNTGVSYRLNPRLTETNIYDPSGNHKRSSVSYSSFSLSCGTGCDLSYYLPFETKEYAPNATDVLRTTKTYYNLSFDYTSRRIFGLPSQKLIIDTADNDRLLSKVDYFYDDSGEFLVQQGTPIQHDTANYGASFVAGRGNLTRTQRWDVIDTSESVESKIGYNTTGSPIFMRDPDPLNHQTTISYTDSFTDVSNVGTYAYPTMTTDADGNQSSSQYSYNAGVVTRSQVPPPNAASPAGATGAYVTHSYDTVGRLYQVTNSFNSASTTYVYPTSSNVVQTYTTIRDTQSPTVSATLLDGAGRVRATAAEHPGSTGGYVGQITVYDLMGRVWQTSNPTEIYGSWQPAGDDAAGWAWSVQTYDWKGRPRVTTNQDLSTKEATYGGCGCAGGEVVTIRDEVNRYSRIYHDVLGRVSKSEELNWDQTIYRTTTTTFNALDQVKRIRQFQGSFTSPRFQDTTLTYDGYARLKTKRRPENDSGTSTSFDYFADDTLQKVTDARGATTNYTYNNRHLLTGITYGVPAGSNIVVTPSVSYSYDAVGNRTQMTDGFGSATYQYDQLSRLTSETRSITEINKSYTFNYGYNIGGELTSISDPADTNRNLTYVYDQDGRLTAVNGNQSAAFANVTQYASNLQYRAWGALKHLTYGTGSGKNLDNQYNPRMQISHFEVNTVMGATFQYYADGRIKFVDDISMETPPSDKFDRSYVYDHVGRLTEATSGTEAHTPPVVTYNRPYNETFGFDEWNNLVARTGQVWTDGMEPVSAEYTDNRRQGWQYDADGQPTLEDTLEHKYDAAGRKYWTRDTTPHHHFNYAFTISQGFDGDGQRLKQVENNGSTYLIRSSVLGQVVWEIRSVSGTWQKKTGFVYAGGRMLATQTIGLWGTQPAVSWRYQNPVTESQRGLEPTELDPLGLNAGLAAQEEGPPGGGDAPDMVFPRYGDILNGNTGCQMDFAMVSCDTAMSAMDSGAAEQCPDNDCGPRVRTVIFRSGGKEVGTEHTIVRPGEPGYDGSLDGTYRRGEVRGEFGIIWGGGIFNRVQGGASFDPNSRSDKLWGLKLLPAGGSYGEGGQARLTKALANIFNSSKCAKAFQDNGLRTPADIILNDGLVIGPATLLMNPSNVNSIGITEAARARDVGGVTSTAIQGITIRDHPGSDPDTTDGSARIFLNASAFGGGYYSLQEVLVHELIHVAGVDAQDPGLWELLGYDDLLNFKGYNDIMAACK